MSTSPGLAYAARNTWPHRVGHLRKELPDNWTAPADHSCGSRPTTQTRQARQRRHRALVLTAIRNRPGRRHWRPTTPKARTILYCRV